jgi:hypothetical protein
VVFEVPCSNVVAFRSWLLGLGLHAEVLAPADVRAEVIQWLTRIAAPDASATEASAAGSN